MKKILIAIAILLIPTYGFAWSWSGGGGSSSGVNTTYDADSDSKVDADKVDVWSGTITDEQLLCGENTDGTNRMKSCGAKTTGFDTVTTGNFIVKAGDTSIGNPTLAIDAHAASTTITLYPGICPIIHNTSQGDNVAAGGTLPAVADGKCFMGLVVTAKDDETFRLVAASVNTVCLDGTCGKDDIGFATTKVVKGSFFTCVGQGTEWFCETGRGTVNAGDL